MSPCTWKRCRHASSVTTLSAHWSSHPFCCVPLTLRLAQRRAGRSTASGGWASRSQSASSGTCGSRLHWNTSAPKTGGRKLLAAFEFDNGWLSLTEAGTQHRASLHVAEGDAGLGSLSAGGIEPLDASPAAFSAALRSANHTLKRSLTDPHIFSGIGNAYSDEILHRAQLSPIAMTQKLTEQEIERLYDATRATLLEWTDRLRAESAGAFPEKVTAFRPGMAVHGRYGQPCPRCGAKVQRIRYASNETNYCAPCQTGGRLLSDRAFSRLLHDDCPRTLDELEALKKR